MKRTIISIIILLVSITIVSAFDCSTLPGEWINVPGNALYNTSDFCVMKYEAKNVSNVPTSQPALNPWVSLTWQQARSNCEDLGNDYHLITDNEWLTIANNIVGQDNNWDSGTVGTGGVFRGNVNLNDAISCGSNSVLDGNTPGTNCVISGGIHDGRNKRTLILSNAEVIWDLAGNIWEYVNDSMPIASRYGGGDQLWMSYNSDDGTGKVASLVPILKLPGSGWNANEGMGRYYDGSSLEGAYNSISEEPDNCQYSCAPIAVFLRGGTWSRGAYAGVFALDLAAGRSALLPSIGFRCSYVHPVTPLIYESFQSHPETTDFSSVADITNVSNPVLATTNAKVQWNAVGMNFNGADIDSAVSFAPNHVSVRSDLLPVLNANATIEFKNVNYAGLESFNVLKDGELCVDPECVKISASPATVEVSGFSNYTTQGTGEVPEFNAFTIAIGLMIVAIGLIIHRRHQSK